MWRPGKCVAMGGNHRNRASVPFPPLFTSGVSVTAKVDNNLFNQPSEPLNVRPHHLNRWCRGHAAPCMLWDLNKVWLEQHLMFMFRPHSSTFYPYNHIQPTLSHQTTQTVTTTEMTIIAYRPHSETDHNLTQTQANRLQAMIFLLVSSQCVGLQPSGWVELLDRNGEQIPGSTGSFRGSKARVMHKSERANETGGFG